MSTEQKDSAQSIWLELATFNHPDESHFIALDCDDNRIFFVVDIDGIYRYNLVQNKWHDLVNSAFYSAIYGVSWEHTTATLQDHILHISDTHGQLLAIDLLSKDVEPSTDELLVSGSFSNSVLINNEYHLIGGANNNKHLKLNSKTKHWETIHTFDECDIGIALNNIIYYDNSLISFGGCAFTDSLSDVEHFDTIYQYQIDQQKWYKLPIKMPQACYTGKPVLVIRNQFILFFGWFNFDDDEQGDIFVFSIKEQKFTKAKIKCPQKSIYSAIVINDAECDEEIVFGYVRQQWKLANICDHYFLPTYLIKLIALYFLTEYVHIIDERSGAHWKVNTLEIV